MLPNSVKTGLIKGLITGDGQIVENILEDMSSNIAIKAERMYRYGQSRYVYGLPNVTMTHSTAGIAVVKATIEAEIEKEISVEYSQYAPFNSLHFGWKKLVDEYGYDQTSNEIVTLSTQKGQKVYLDDMYVVVPESLLPDLTGVALAQWGVAAKAGYTPLRPMGNIVGAFSTPTPPQINAQATAETVRVLFTWEQPEAITVDGVTIIRKILKTESMEFAVPDVADNLAFFQAKYSYQEPNGKLLNPVTQIEEDQFLTRVRYFTYQEGEGTYPEIDSIFKVDYEELGSFFPFAYFRYNKVSQTANPTSTAFKSSKKLLKYLNMDYPAVADAINANPDINDVEQAMMVMAVPAVSTDPVEIRYLYDFFFGVYIDSGAVGMPKSEVAGAITVGLNPVNAVRAPTISLVIQDALFKMALTMTGIYRKRVVGSIGAKGHHTCGTATKIVTQTMTSMDESGNVSTYKQEVPVEYIYYRKQVTAGVYQEIQVVGLNMAYYVWEGYTATADTILVPLDYSITQHYNNRDREILYARSLHYVFNSKHETKIKWYQQGWFKAVLIIVAVVITIVTLGADGGASLSAAIAAATASAEAFLMTILVTGLQMLLINYGLKLFVKLLGPEVAMILAIVAAVVAVGYAIEAGGFANAPFAKDLLSLSSGLTKASGNYYTDALQGIKKEYESFGLEMKVKNELLESSKKLLEGNNILNPFVIFGESPSDYYNRTVHSGNIGITSIDAISSYVDIALTLPKLHQSIGEIL